MKILQILIENGLSCYGNILSNFYKTISISYLNMNDNPDDWEPDPEVIDDIVTKLSSIENQDEKALALGDERYSVKQVIEHVKEGTPVGRQFYNMHLSLIERLEEIKEKSPFNMSEIYHWFITSGQILTIIFWRVVYF